MKEIQWKQSREGKSFLIDFWGFDEIHYISQPRKTRSKIREDKEMLLVSILIHAMMQQLIVAEGQFLQFVSLLESFFLPTEKHEIIKSEKVRKKKRRQ